MTEWDHGHDGHGDGPDLPDHDPGWEASGPDGQLAEPAGPDHPYGLPDHPGPEPHDAGPAEPAGFPEEKPADWSGSGDDVLHAGPDAWEPDHGPFDPDPAGPADGTDPAGWTVAADPFPPALDLDVQPGDAGPWADPALLGDPDHGTGVAEPAPPADPPAALLPDLAAADGDPDAGWDTLRDSDDPAVRALALRWNPDHDPCTHLHPGLEP
ncbi:MAG TPA: hypothetical protein VI357_08230 [Mycobacteriales bacterium]